MRLEAICSTLGSNRHRGVHRGGTVKSTYKISVERRYSSIFFGTRLARYVYRTGVAGAHLSIHAVDLWAVFADREWFFVLDGSEP